MRVKHFSPHVRIILRKNHIWISEFLGLLLVISVIAALCTLGSIALLNYITMKKNQSVLLRTGTGYIELSHTLDELREKEKIASVLNTVTRKKLSGTLLASLTELVYQNSKTFGYDPLLVLAVIRVESWFEPAAKGQYRSGKYSGAFGLMQLKIETAKEVADALNIPFHGEKDLYNPTVNIPLGVAYLTQQISQFRSLKLGIMAYNLGPGTVLSTLEKKQPLSKRYYNKVLKNYFALTQMREEIVRLQ